MTRTMTVSTYINEAFIAQHSWDLPAPLRLSRELPPRLLNHLVTLFLPLRDTRLNDEMTYAPHGVTRVRHI